MDIKKQQQKGSGDWMAVVDILLGHINLKTKRKVNKDRIESCWHIGGNYVIGIGNIQEKYKG